MAFCAIGIIGYVRYFNDRFGGDDDYFWLYLTGARIGRADRASPILDAIVSYTERYGSHDAIYEAETRRAYIGNYIGPSVVYRTVSWWLARGGSWPYHRVFAFGLGWGFVASFLLTLAVAASALVSSRDTRTIAAGGLAMTLALVCEHWVPTGNQYVAVAPTIVRAYAQGLRFLLNPTFNFSAVGMTPRSQFALLTFAVFGLRTVGRYGSSYGLVLLLAAVHQSYAGLFLIALLACDICYRPAVLRRASVMPWWIAALGTFMVRESLWRTLGGSVVLTFAGVVMSMTIVFWARSTLLRSWDAAIGKVPQALLPFADVILLGALWIFTLPIGQLATRITSPDVSLYFWSQIHGRSLALFRCAVFFAVSYGMLGPFLKRFGEVALAGMAIVCCALVLAIEPWHVSVAARINQLSEDVKSLDDRSEVPLREQIGTREGLVYYETSKTLDTGTDHISGYLR